MSIFDIIHETVFCWFANNTCSYVFSIACGFRHSSLRCKLLWQVMTIQYYTDPLFGENQVIQLILQTLGIQIKCAFEICYKCSWRYALHHRGGTRIDAGPPDGVNIKWSHQHIAPFIELNIWEVAINWKKRRHHIL